ncbi:IS256 family transposase [Salsipaludibacter albus]|uniref:IS256 family transposase n=1 Tax=Salsipaludibacter albus TaxID=2849650 RepID=UPI001EE4A13A|nr:IS256 family transposase [Salsipaludibacter albus]MBY5163146.1 IS256 family transposase [Salsipaludibacter albus]
MTHYQSAMHELAERLQDADATLTTSIADILGAAIQELIEAELSARIGAEPGERTPWRTAQRNGHRPKRLSTPAGDVELAIPKLRTGSFFPELLEPRRRIDKALWAVIMRAYVTGTSTRKVDDLVKALGCDSGISKSTVSRICKLIDDDVAVLRQRRLDHLPFVYVWLDATYVHVREHGQVISKAVVIATGCRADGHREVLGVDIGHSENETFWTEFLRGLVDRGLDGVRLVVSDAHAGLRAAITRVLQGAAWQRCRVHAKRNLLAVARHQHRTVVSAAVSTIFAQPDADAARAQLRRVVDQLIPIEPAVAERLQAMEDDLLAYTSFPPVHWSKIWSNNPIERLNRELKRRTDVVQIFPDPESVIRLVGALLVEVSDELVAAPRRYIAEATLTPLTNQEDRLPSLPAAPRT